MPTKPKRHSTLQRRATAIRMLESNPAPWSSEAQREIDAFLDALEFERMEAEDFIETISAEERSGRGADRILSDHGGRVHRAKGSE